MLKQIYFAAIAAVLIAIIAVSIVGYLIYRERTRPPQILAEIYSGAFLEEQNPDVRFNNLANLFRLEGYDDEAREAYFKTLEDEQGAVFGALGDPGQLGEDSNSKCRENGHKKAKGEHWL